MGMYATLKPITEAEVNRLVAEKKLTELIVSDDAQATALDKAWHAIHYMLSGDAWGGEGPLADAIMGGEEVGKELGYGKARYLSVEKTRAVAEALSALPAETLAQRFDAETMVEEEIYPSIWEDDPEELLEYVLSFYQPLQECYAKAAAAGEGMLLAVI